MKKIILFNIALFFTSLGIAQHTDFSLIGKWQEKEYHGNNGATDYVLKIEKGRIFIFESDTVIKDGFNAIGTYELNENRLHIVFPKKELFYRIFFENNNPKRISFVPVTNNYDYYCDEGCAEIFEKSEYQIEHQK